MCFVCERFEQFNTTYLRRFLIREEKQVRLSILKVYQELEWREQQGDEEAPPPVWGNIYVHCFLMLSEGLMQQKHTYGGLIVIIDVICFFRAESHSQQLSPEKLDSIRRILSRNLHNFNKVSTFFYLCLVFFVALQRFKLVLSSKSPPTADTPGRLEQDQEDLPQTPESGRDILIQYYHTEARGTASTKESTSAVM